MTERRGHSTNSRILFAVRLTAIQLIASLILAAGVASAATSVQAAPVARAATAQASAANVAETFVQQNIDKGYEILNNMKIAESERHAQFRNFLLGLIDSRRISMFTLGQYASGASQADIDAFTSAFTDYAEAVVGSSARAADDVVVNCESTDPAHPADPPYKVAFRVRKNADGKFTVTDLNIEGIWQALTQRADFTGFLQQHGGRIAELTLDLNRAKRDIANERNGERFRTDQSGFRPANAADDRLRPAD